jgi:polyisoprenoid-binding protein YceI
MRKLLLPLIALLGLVITFSAFKKDAAGIEKITAPTPKYAPTKWTIDKSHSNVKFTVTHLVISDVEGYFKIFEGSLEHSNPDFSDAKINFTVDVNSINTDNENRDKHLKSDDFFSAEKFPQMKFESTSFTSQGGNKYKLTGNLTIRDVTKAATFDVTYGGIAKMGKTTKSGFKAKGTINRFDYGLKWDRATEAGGMVVGKEVEIVVNAELNQAAAQ